MSRIITFLLFPFFILFLFSACRSSQIEAKIYFETVSRFEKKARDIYDSCYFKSNAWNQVQLKTGREALVKIMATFIDSIKVLEVPDGGNEFQESAIQVIKVEKSLMENEIKDWFDYRIEVEKDSEQFLATGKSNGVEFKTMESISDSIFFKKDCARQQFKKEAGNFTKKYKIIVIGDF